jgi:hypothetical protein
MKKFLSKLGQLSINQILKSLVAISLIVMSFGTLISAYLQQVYTETISFFVRDGWCDEKTQGIGIHCFGDFYAPISVASESNPWSNDLNLAYTPLNFSYFRILSSPLTTSLGSHFALAINFFVTLVCLSIPGIFIWRNRKRFQSISGPWVLLLSVVSAPSIMLIDRGSSSFLLFPLTFFFYRSLLEDNHKQATLTLLIMTLWKTQTFILVVGILIYMGVKPFLRTAFLVSLSFICSFVLYPKNYLENIFAWLENSAEYQNYVPIPTPGNYSFINFVGIVRGGVNLVTGSATSLGEAFRPPLAPLFVSAFSATFALLAIGLLIYSRKEISKDQFILISSVFLLTIPGTSFGYYLSLMLIPLFVIPQTDDSEANSIGRDRLLWTPYLLLLTLMVPAWPFNWSNLPINLGAPWQTLGVHWTLVHAVTSMLVLLSAFRLISLILFPRSREQSKWD